MTTIQQNITYQQFALAALKWGNKATSVNNVRSLVAWMCSENALTNNAEKADWNPFDTTEEESGATDFNSAGVRNYTSINEGLTAFWATLNNGLYNHILTDLDNSAIPAITCQDICDSPWGSQPTSELLGTVLGNFAHYANLDIGEKASIATVVTLTPMEKLIDEVDKIITSINIIYNRDSKPSVQDCDDLIIQAGNLNAAANQLKSLVTSAN